MTSQNNREPTLDEIEVRLEELNKLPELSPKEREEFVHLILLRAEVLDRLHELRTGRKPIL